MPARPSIPQKLDKLAEVAIKVGLGLQARAGPLHDGADQRAAAGAPRSPSSAYKAGAGLVTTIFSDEEITLARYRYGNDASFDRAAGWLLRGRRQGLRRQHRAARDRRRQPDAAGRAGPRQGRPRQPRHCQGLQAGAEQDRQFRHQLDHRALSGHRRGPSRCSPTTPRTSRSASSPTRSLPRPASRPPDPVAAWAEHNARLKERQRLADGQELHARSNIPGPAPT